MVGPQHPVHPHSANTRAARHVRLPTGSLTLTRLITNTPKRRVPDDASRHSTANRNPVPTLLTWFPARISHVRPIRFHLWHPPRNIPGLFGHADLSHTTNTPGSPSKLTSDSPSLTQKFSPWSEHWKSIASVQPPIFRHPIQNPAVPENEPSNEVPVIPPWIGNCEGSSAGGITSERPLRYAGET